MDIRSDRQYQFAAPPAAVWSAFASVQDYRRWWPWLRRFDAGALAIGQVWDCVVQPPLPYSLHFTITLDDVVEGRAVAAAIDGDIHGSARLDLAPDGTGSRLRLVSQLAPNTRSLRAIALAARPVARFGHDWVLDTGARQFIRRALP